MFTSTRKLVEFLTSNIPGLKYVTTAANIMTVTVKQGKLKGAENQLYDGSPYYSFKGIPYAEAPTGKQRFMAPLPPQPWHGTYEAIKHGPVCPQYDLTTSQMLEGDEHCLFLNVYTKSLQTDSNLPVMIFIHGGGFMSGSGNTDSGLGPEFLLQHDVILVTINYRLEMLGFLNLEIPEIPGNAGMKDQVAAMRWVQTNIQQFGGDPNNVTIFGESAGSASVIYHMHSPMSKGLFHKAIAQSGVSLHPWAQDRDGKARAFRAGKALGKDTTNVSELLEFLQSLPAVKLVKATFKSMTVDEKHRGLPLYFVPVLEKKFDNVEPFLTEEPVNMLLENKLSKVPLMLGYNSLEGMIMVDNRINKLKFYNQNPQYFVPRHIAQRVSDEKMRELGERIKRFYVGNRDFTPDDAVKIAEMLSDFHFVYDIHRFGYFYSAMCESVYMYKFSCDTELNVLKRLIGKSDMRGASHADDLFYLFDSALNIDAYKEDERLRDIVYRVTKLWTDFAKTGNPTPDGSLGVKWLPYTADSKQYLDIDETFTLSKNADMERVDFWNKLYCEAGLPCMTKSNL